MLKRFADEFEFNYGQDNVSMNIHRLRHIADEVQYSGPLWANSLFGFEAMNGVLVKMVNGTNNFLLQITNRDILKQTLTGTQSKVKRNPDILKYGKINSKPTTDEEFVLSNHRISFDEISLWKSKSFKGEKYTSTMYKETKSIDYFVEFENELYGKIRYYVMSKNMIYAMLEVFTTEKNIDHLSEVVATGSLSLVPVSEIRQKLIYMSMCSREITSKLPNKFEKT